MTTRFDRLLAGLIVPKPVFIKDADRRGLEHITADDTLDADYGRLLERAEKGWLEVVTQEGHRPRLGEANQREEPSSR